MRTQIYNDNKNCEYHNCGNCNTVYVARLNGENKVRRVHRLNPELCIRSQPLQS